MCVRLFGIHRKTMNKNGFKCKYYRTIFELCFDAILLTRLDGRVIKVNQAACALFGLSETELCALNCDAIVDPDDSRFQTVLEQRKLEGQVKTELNFKHKDGTIISGFLTSALFEDDQGEMLAIMIIRDITREKEYIRQLEAMKVKAEEDAMLDYLTNSLNRRGFDQLFRAEVTRSIRFDLGFCLAILDVDLFKMTNDRYGHTVGDVVLVEIARILMESIRPYDIFGRYGGDEFILCLPNTNEQEGLVILERLRQAIESHIIYVEDHTIRSSVSIGLCHFDQEEVKKRRYDDFIQCADQYMYQAKQIRNTVCYRGFRKD